MGVSTHHSDNDKSTERRYTARTQLIDIVANTQLTIAIVSPDCGKSVFRNDNLQFRFEALLSYFRVLGVSSVPCSINQDCNLVSVVSTSQVSAKYPKYPRICPLVTI